MILKDTDKNGEQQVHDLDLHSYDHYVVFFSGGKDSMACLLWLLENDVPRERIELWHHDIDGMKEAFMDWPCTVDYCRRVAEAFGIRYYLSYKEGGFFREMHRNNEPTAPIHFQDENGQWKQTGGKGKPNTRRKFPQVSADLGVRWCSAYLKIDVGTAAINNQERFKGARTLTVSGERAEESASRAKYKMLEADRADNRDGKKTQRHVDRVRPIKWWTKWEVWDMMKKYRVNPHPAYWLGLGRVSCMKCIFGSKDQFATVKSIDPEGFQELVGIEKDFGVTMKRDKDLESLAESGEVLEATKADPQMQRVAMSETFWDPVLLPANAWEYPPGVHGEDCGPI